jgi:hypothetical protein
MGYYIALHHQFDDNDHLVSWMFIFSCTFDFLIPLRKHKIIDNQPFFTLTIKGKTPAPKGV